MTKIVNVFISHLHEDDDGLAKFKNLVKRHGLVVRDGSINAKKPNQAKDPSYIMNNIIGPGIDWCGTFVVYVTPKTKDSEWVEKEILRAENRNKPIVAVWAEGHSGCELPEHLDQMADAIVKWNGENIVDAITGKFNGREDASGKVCPNRPYKRYKC